MIFRSAFERSHLFRKKVTHTRHPSLKSICFVTAALALSLCGFPTARAADVIQPDPDKIPMASSQLVMTVEQSGVPQVAVKGSPKVIKVRALTIKLRSVGRSDGKVTLKIAFVGTDVTTDKKTINRQIEKKAEALPGKDTEYTVTSAPFVYVPPSVDLKTKKRIPESGTKPFGWVVRVYQGGKLLKATSSNPDLVDWIGTQ